MLHAALVASMLIGADAVPSEALQQAQQLYDNFRWEEVLQLTQAVLGAKASTDAERVQAHYLRAASYALLEEAGAAVSSFVDLLKLEPAFVLPNAAQQEAKIQRAYDAAVVLHARPQQPPAVPPEPAPIEKTPAATPLATQQLAAPPTETAPWYAQSWVWITVGALLATSAATTGVLLWQDAADQSWRNQRWPDADWQMKLLSLSGQRQ